MKPLAQRIVESKPGATVLGWCWNGRKLVWATAGGDVYICMADSSRPSRGAPKCTRQEWGAGFRPKRIGKVTDQYNPFPLWDDTQRVEVVEGGGWPFWGGSDGWLVDDGLGGYAPQHGSEKV